MSVKFDIKVLYQQVWIATNTGIYKCSYEIQTKLLPGHSPGRIYQDDNKGEIRMRFN